MRGGWGEGCELAIVNCECLPDGKAGSLLRWLVDYFLRPIVTSRKSCTRQGHSEKKHYRKERFEKTHRVC